jgi:hypothetical protein
MRMRRQVLVSLHYGESRDGYWAELSEYASVSAARRAVANRLCAEPPHKAWKMFAFVYRYLTNGAQRVSQCRLVSGTPTWVTKDSPE